jgi:hypothetical protein
VSAPQSHDDREARRCTHCGAPARFVASAGSLSWFECGEHGPTENLAAVIRDKLEPIDAWRARMAAEGQTALRREQVELAEHFREAGDNELAALVELMTKEP